MNDIPDTKASHPQGKIPRRLALAGVMLGSVVVVTGLLVTISYVYQVWNGLDAGDGNAGHVSDADMPAFFNSLHYSETIAIGVTLLGLAVLAASLWALPRRK